MKSHKFYTFVWERYFTLSDDPTIKEAKWDIAENLEHTADLLAMELYL